MGYAVEADIRRHLGKYSDAWPPASGKPPTVADGIKFADNASGELDGILAAHGLTTPVAAPASFVERLRDLAAVYAASLVVAAIFPQASGPASTTHHEFLMGIYRDGRDALRRGEGLPPATTGKAIGRSFWTTHPDYFAEDHEGTAGNQTDPVFRRDTAW
jgi:hypothetical protein